MSKMSIFGEIGSKITESSKKVVKGVNDFAETAKLKDQIEAEKKKQATLYQQLGQLLFTKFPEQCEMEPFASTTQALTASMQTVEQLKAEVERLQASSGRTCLNCGAVCKADAVFCSSCGGALAPAPSAVKAATRFCASCGGDLNEGDTFCMNCGTRVEETPAVEETPI